MFIEKLKLHQILTQYQLYELEELTDKEFSSFKPHDYIDSGIVKDIFLNLLHRYESSDTEQYEDLEFGKKIMKDTKGGQVVPLNDKLEPIYSKSQIVHARDVICEYYRMKDAMTVFDILFFF